jgi:hypothetical protein
MVEVLAGESDDAIRGGILELAYITLVLANALPFDCTRGHAQHKRTHESDKATH